MRKEGGTVSNSVIKINRARSHVWHMMVFRLIEWRSWDFRFFEFQKIKFQFKNRVSFLRTLMKNAWSKRDFFFFKEKKNQNGDVILFVMDWVPEICWIMGWIYFEQWFFNLILGTFNNFLEVSQRLWHVSHWKSNKICQKWQKMWT